MTASGWVVFIDSRATLGPNGWANELHPKAAGFNKIAREKWKPALQSAGIA